ncbi:MAG: hypothetical protein GTO02_22285 [Candidatus Dadabacteria bacterium]|nr:hypothetical protein [Candidatus Dadabacteria bacterium]
MHRIKLSDKQLKMNYTKWYKSLTVEKKTYLRQIGISDNKRLTTLSAMKFNLLPSDIRTELQIKEVIQI